MQDFKPIIYDERDMAEEIVSSAKVSYNWFYAMLVAKYARHVRLFGATKTKKFVIEFFFERDPDFNYVRFRKSIAKIIKKSEKPMLKTGSITITENELSKIRKLKNFKHQKICLAILLISKRETNSGYISKREWGHIRRVVSRKITNSDIQRVFHEMYVLGYTEPLGSSQRISISENNDFSPAIINITDDKKATFVCGEYVKYCGGELGYCPSCGKEFVKENSRKVLCQPCTREKLLTKYKKYNEKRRLTTQQGSPI